MTPTGLITMRFNRPITLNFAGARRDRNLASLSEDEKVVIYPILKSAFQIDFSPTDESQAALTDFVIDSFDA